MEALCSMGAKQVYIYEGGRAESFNGTQLEAGQWTVPAFRAGGVGIYELEGCGESRK
jgi:hypothetical protein